MKFFAEDSSLSADDFEVIFSDTEMNYHDALSYCFLNNMRLAVWNEEHWIEVIDV